MSIRSRIILLVILLLAAMAAGVLFAMRPHLAARAEADFARHAREQLQRMEETVDLALRRGEVAAAALAALPEVRAAAHSRAAEADPFAALSPDRAESTGTPGGTPQSDSATAVLTRRLGEAVTLVPETENAFYLFADGSVLAAPGSTPMERDAAWYSDMAYASRPAPVNDAYISATGKGLAGTVTARIRSDAGDVLGLAVLERNLAPLMDALRDIRPGRGGYVVLFDASGRVLLDPVAQENLLRHPADIPDEALLLLARLPEGRADVTRGGVAYAAFVHPLAGPQWRAAFLIDRTDLTASANSTFFSLVLVICTAAALLTGVGVLGAFRITRPLEALIRQSAALAEGNGAALAAIPERGPDIAALHASLGALLGRVMLLTRAERDKARAAEDQGREADAARARADAADRAAEATRTDLFRAGAAREAARKAVALAESVGAAAALAAVEQGRAVAAAARLEAALLADKTRSAALAGSVAALTGRADELVAGLPLLARPVQAGATLAREMNRAATGVAELAARLPESLASMKPLAAEMGGAAAALRELAGALNVAGLTASIEATGAGEAGAALTAAAGEARAQAQHAMTLAARIDAATAAFEQAHAAHAMATAKGAAAAQRAAELAEKNLRAAALAESGTLALAGQIRNLEAACDAPKDAPTGEECMAKALAAARETLAHVNAATAPLNEAAVLVSRIREAAVVPEDSAQGAEAGSIATDGPATGSLGAAPKSEAPAVPAKDQGGCSAPGGNKANDPGEKALD